MSSLRMVSYLGATALTIFGLSAHASLCERILNGLTDRHYLESIPDPRPMISQMPKVVQQAKAIHSNPELSDEEKAKQIFRLYFDTRLTLLSPAVKAAAEKALANISEVPSISLWEEIRTAMAHEAGPPKASHAGKDKIVIAQIFTILRLTYGAVVAHEFAHVVQLNMESSDRMPGLLALFDVLFNPLPREGRRTARRETGAFAEQWDYLQLFDKPYRQRAITIVEESELPNSKKMSIIKSLEYADLPREQFIERMKQLNNHTNFHAFAQEVFFKIAAYSATIAGLFYFF